MIEFMIIKFLLLRNFYIKYRRFIKEEKEHSVLLSCIDKLQDTLERDVTFAEFRLCCLNVDSSLVDKLDMLEQQVVDISIAEEVVKQYAERQVGHELALRALAVSEGKASLDDCRTLLEGVDIVEKVEYDDFYDGTPEELLAALDRRSGGLRWRLNSLDTSLGGLRQGDFGFIFARAETGKTTFLASEISHFATQTDDLVIWANNEEAKQKVRGRMLQGSLGIHIDEFQMETNAVWDRFRQEFPNFKLYDAVPMSKRDIETIVQRYKPGLLVIDQIDKIRGFKADRDDLMLGAIYQWAREIAKEYCPVIGVCQAAATAEGKKWLTSDDIAKSKTEKLAEADFVIGIGKSHDNGHENIRYLHLIKNKLTGLHQKISCRIDASIARYRDF